MKCTPCVCLVINTQTSGTSVLVLVREDNVSIDVMVKGGEGEEGCTIITSDKIDTRLMLLFFIYIYHYLFYERLVK